MFKQGSCENELFRSMEQVLVKNQADKASHGLTKIAKAVDYLNEAAAIFEQAGMMEEAELVAQALQSLVKDLA